MAPPTARALATPILPFAMTLPLDGRGARGRRSVRRRRRRRADQAERLAVHAQRGQERPVRVRRRGRPPAARLLDLEADLIAGPPEDLILEPHMLLLLLELEVERPGLRREPEMG